MSAENLPPVIKTVQPRPAAAPQGPRRVAVPQLRPPRTTKGWETAFRVLIVVLLAVSVGLAWWSYAMVLTPRIERSARLTSELSALSAQVDNLERVWTADQLSEVTNRFTTARSLLFADDKSLESWLSTIGKQAAPLAIDVKTTFATPMVQDTNYAKLAVIPATVAIEVSPAPEGTLMPSRYNRLLQLVDKVAATQKRIDLAELNVRGGTNSSDRAVMTLNLWAGEVEAK